MFNRGIDFKTLRGTSQNTVPGRNHTIRAGLRGIIPADLCLGFWPSACIGGSLRNCGLEKQHYMSIRMLLRAQST